MTNINNQNQGKNNQQGDKKNFGQQQDVNKDKQNQQNLGGKGGSEKR